MVGKLIIILGKNFKKKYLLIKYEDLINNEKKFLKKYLNLFIKKKNLNMKINLKAIK